MRVCLAHDLLLPMLSRLFRSPSRQDAVVLAEILQHLTQLRCMLRVIGAREVRKCRKCDAMPSEGKKLQLPGTTCLKLWPCTRKSRCRSWGYSREAAVKITTVPLCAGQSKPEPRNQIIVYIARFFIHRKTIMICSASQRCRQLLN